MPSVVVLDTGPLGLVTKRPGKSNEVNDCLQWIADITQAGWRIVVPEIADYEVRRELLRTANITGIARLDAFNMARMDRYIPVTTSAIRLAASLWAQARNIGVGTADAQALDGDVIVAAQALTLGLPASEIIVATVNVNHLVRYIAADRWENINP